MKRLLLEQRREVERAVAGLGEYKLVANFEHLSVTPQKWFKMNEAQRRRKVQQFFRASMDTTQPDSGSEAPSSSSQEESIHNPLSSLDIPSHTKIQIWSSAQHYLSDLSAICKSPGEEDAWLVKSSQDKRPHYVKLSKSNRCNRYICDSDCLTYKSSKICAHSVAVAEKNDHLESFLKWFKSQKPQLNLTNLAESGKPSTSGKKGPHRKASTKKGTKYIRDILSRAEESSFRTRAPRQTPTSTSSVPSQPSTASHHSSMASQQTPMVTQQTSMASQQTPMVTQQLSTEPEKVATTPLQMSYVPQQMSAYPCWMPSVSQPLSLAPAVSSAHQIHTHPASAVSAVFTVPHQVGTVSSTPTPVSTVPAQLSTVLSLVPVISMVNQSMHTLHPASQVPFINQSPGQCTAFGQPPPLVPIASPSSAATSPVQPASQQRPQVETPFWVTFVFGNVSRCNGCKGKIARDSNKKALPPPDDIVLQHKEYVVYQNSRTGYYEQSRDVRNVYYHPWKTCIASHFADFQAIHHIKIKPEVLQKFQIEHVTHFQTEFGLQFS